VNGVTTRIAVIGLTVATALAIAASAPAAPIPSSGTTSLPDFQGAPAKAHPVTGVSRTPQNPFMAPNGNGSVHNDAWASDAYTRSGPMGRSPKTLSEGIGQRVCITLTFDSHGRVVGSCISHQKGPRLYMFDPRTLNPLARLQLPSKPPPSGTNPLTNTAGGAYFYLDNRDRVVSATTNRHIWIVKETGGRANPGFRRVRDFDLKPYLPQGERIVSVLPDWSGRLWFVGRYDGIVGVLNPKTGSVKVTRLNEEIENSFAVGRHGVYIASDKAMYRFGTSQHNAPRVIWRSTYPNTGITKPGQFNAGTGTTPTVMQNGYVAIADNADPMDVVVYRTATHLGAGVDRKVCEQPVFKPGKGATENSLITAGRSLIVENNYGYDVLHTNNGALSEPGIARVDVKRDGSGCRLVWTNKRVDAPSVVPKLSLANGLIYTYTKESDPANPTTDVWAWTALDFRNGRTVWKRIAGTGLGYNNHYAGIALGPDGRTAYLGGIGGLMGIRDRRH
jgi:hypothetical protein